MYVDTNKIISNPLKIGRYLYLEEYFLGNLKVASRGKFSKEKLEELLSFGWEKAKNTNITAPLESYKIHQIIQYEKYLPALKGKNIILCPGTSIDLSETRLEHNSYDWTAESFRLSTEILWSLNLVDQKHLQEYGDPAKKLENYIFRFFSPFYFPAAVRRVGEGIQFSRTIGNEKQELNSESQLVLAYPWQEIFGEVNARLPERKHINVLRFEKRLGEEVVQKGKYQSSDLLYNSTAAKKALINYRMLSAESARELEDRIELSCCLDKQIAAMHLASQLRREEQHRLLVFSKLSGELYDILELLPREEFEIKKVGGEKGPMRNAGMSKFGECDPSAQSILRQKLWMDLIS